MASAKRPSSRASIKSRNSGLFGLLPSRRSLTACIAPNLSRGRSGKLTAAAFEESLEGALALDVSYVSYNAGMTPSGAAPRGLAVSLGSAGPSLRHLDLSKTAHLEKGGQEAFGKALVGSLARCPSLRTLKLAGNGLRDAGLELLLSALSPHAETPAPSLEELDLSWNRIRDGNLVARLVVDCGQRLRCLNLEANELGDVAVVALCAGLSLNLKVQSLNLARNLFGDEGLVALANALRHQQLSDAEAGGGSRAVATPRPSLARWLVGMHCALEQGGAQPTSGSELGLKQLDVSCTRVADSGALALAAALKASGGDPKLGVLTVHGTSIGSCGRAALEEAVRERQACVSEYAKAAGLAIRGEGPEPEGSMPRLLVVRGLGLEALNSELAAGMSGLLESVDAAMMTPSGPDGSPKTDRSAVIVEHSQKQSVMESFSPKTVPCPDSRGRFGMMDCDSEQPLDEPESEASMPQIPAAPEVERSEPAKPFAPELTTEGLGEAREQHEAEVPVAPAPTERDDEVPVARAITERDDEVNELRARRIVQQQRQRVEEGTFFTSPASSPEPEQEVDCGASSSGTPAGGQACVARISPAGGFCERRSGSKTCCEHIEDAIRRASSGPRVAISSGGGCGGPAGSAAPAGCGTPELSPAEPAAPSVQAPQGVAALAVPRLALPEPEALAAGVAAAVGGPPLMQAPEGAAALAAPRLALPGLETPPAGAAAAAVPALAGGPLSARCVRASAAAAVAAAGTPLSARRMRVIRASTDPGLETEHEVRLQAGLPPWGLRPPPLIAARLAAEAAGLANSWAVNGYSPLSPLRAPRPAAAAAAADESEGSAVREPAPKAAGKAKGKGGPPGPPPGPKALGGAPAQQPQACPSGKAKGKGKGPPPPPPPPGAKAAGKACPAGPEAAPAGKAKGKGKGPPPPPPGAKGAGAAPAQGGDPSAAEPAAAPKGKGKGKGGKGGPPPPPLSRAATSIEVGAAAPADGGKGAPPAPKGKGKGKAPLPKANGSAAPKAASQQQLRSRAATIAPVCGSAPFHRKIYWKPLELQCMEGTIFEDGDLSTSSHIDTGALQRMFEGESAKLAAAAAKSSSLMKSVQGKAEGTKILSDNRARNIAIILRRLPISTTDLSQTLCGLEWENDLLRTDQVEQILDAIPTKEETDQLRPHADPEACAKLRDVEQMVLPLTAIRRGSARVRLICCARNATAQAEAAAGPLATLREACAAIHGSEMLRVVMLSAIEIGNYINNGDSNMGAKAITIGSLLQLRDFKMGRMSSLHFLCAQLRLADASRDASEVLQNELRSVVDAAKFQIQGISQAVRAFDGDVNMVAAEYKSFAQEYDDAGGPDEEEEPEEPEMPGSALLLRGSARQRLKRLASVVERMSKQLHEDLDTTTAQVQETLRFCGVKASKSADLPVDIEPFLVQLAEFLRAFRQHWGDVNDDLPRYSAFFTGEGLQE